MFKLACAVLALAAFVHADTESTTALPKLPPYSVPVVILNSTNFEKTVYCGGGKDCPSTLVQFCRSTMDICEEYVSEYRTAAEFAGPWTSATVLRLAYVDCSTNQDLCQRYGYIRMPLLKYYERDANYGDKGKKLRTYTKAEYILDEAAGAVNNEYRKRKYYHTDWPNFSLLADVNNASDVWSFFDVCDTQAFIVPVQNAHDPRGMTRFISAFNKAQGKFPVARVLQNHTLVTAQKIPESFVATHFMIKRELKDASGCGKPEGEVEKLQNYTQFLNSFGNRDIVGDKVVLTNSTDENMLFYRYETEIIGF